MASLWFLASIMEASVSQGCSWGGKWSEVYSPSYIILSQPPVFPHHSPHQVHPGEWCYCLILFFTTYFLDISWVIKSHRNTANSVAWQTLYKTEELKGSVRTLLCLVKFLYGAYRQKRQSRLRASGPFPLTLESQKKFSNKTRECVFLSEMGPKQHFFLNKMSQVSDFHFSYVNFIIFLWVFILGLIDLGRCGLINFKEHAIPSLVLQSQIL